MGQVVAGLSSVGQMGPYELEQILRKQLAAKEERKNKKGKRKRKLRRPLMDVKPLEQVKVTILARGEHAWLRKDLQPLIDSKKILYYDVDEDPSVLEKAGVTLEELDQPMAIVSPEGAADAEACVISAVGKSTIIHCPDAIVPLQ